MDGYSKRKWTVEDRRKLASGEIRGAFAGPERTFPIAGPGDVGDAWGLAGHAANPDGVRRRIISIARRFGWLSGLPASAREWAEERSIDLKKGMDMDEELEPLMDDWAVKMLGGNRVGGYAVLWGSENERDLDGEWFDRDTEEMDAIFKAMGVLPYLYNHATDDTLKSTVVGRVDVLQADSVGLWYEAQLDANNEYKDAIRRLTAKKVLGTSSGTLPGARRVEKIGRIARWPFVELSATPMPADPRQLERPIAEIKSAFKSIGLEFQLDMETESGKGDEESRRKVEIEAGLGMLDLIAIETGIAPGELNDEP